MTINITTGQTTGAHTAPKARPSLLGAMRRGARYQCPSCGQGRLYSAYLKVVDQCDHCGEELHHHRADDAPPYFTIFVVGHIIVAGVLFVEQTFAPDSWVHALIWVPLTLLLSLAFLPRVKGLLVGLQWSLGMHGFAKDAEPAAKGDETQPELPT